jgi:hypothetical protein
MNGCPPDEPALQRFIEEIATLPPRPHHTTLLAAAKERVPACDFRFALTRGGWYRPGGVIRPDGTRLADDLEAWAETELDACGGDMGGLLERHANGGLLATRQAGRTHYFVAPFGPEPADFLQLEVEELQEVVDRELIDRDHPPSDLQELTEPLAPARHAAQPVGRSRYVFRRLADMRRTLARQPAPIGGQSPLARFMGEWSASSAALNHFCEHWIVAIGEHLDRHRNSILAASPVSLHARSLKAFHWNLALVGVEMGKQLLDFDRAAGYPGAWYFPMVSGGLTPREIAATLAADLDANFNYLREPDTKLLVDWMRAPYSA